MAFRDVSGQERAVSVLRAAASSGRVAHAYLFAGLDGVGKETTALAFARALLCETVSVGPLGPSSPEPDGCGSCGGCRKVDARTHPDLHLVLPEKDVLGIDRIRELCGRLVFAPFEGRFKVAVIRDAHRMNEPAQNALLKTLEEPPGRAVIVLVTAASHLLLPTVRSRCQRLVFAPLTPAFLRARVAVATGRPEDDPGVGLAVALAEGSLGRALGIAGADVYAGRQELVAGVRALRRERPSAALELAQAWGGDRGRTAEALEILQLWYRDRLLAAVDAGVDPVLPDVAADVAVGARESIAALEHLHEARQGLLVNANPQLTLERTFLALASDEGT